MNLLKRRNISIFANLKTFSGWIHLGWKLRLLSTQRKEKKRGDGNGVLDLSLVQDRSKGLATMIKESYGKLSLLTVLVSSASHFPGLSRSGHVHSAFGTFSHDTSPAISALPMVYDPRIAVVINLY